MSTGSLLGICSAINLFRSLMVVLHSPVALRRTTLVLSLEYVISTEWVVFSLYSSGDIFFFSIAVWVTASDVTCGSVPVPMELFLMLSECLWRSRLAECGAVVSCCAGYCLSLVLGGSSESCLSSCWMFGGW